MVFTIIRVVLLDVALARKLGRCTSYIIVYKGSLNLIERLYMN